MLCERDDELVSVVADYASYEYTTIRHADYASYEYTIMTNWVEVCLMTFEMESKKT